MALWKRLFGKGSAAAAVEPVARGEVAQYCEKYNKYLALINESKAIREIGDRLREALTGASAPEAARLQQLCLDLLPHLDQAMALIQTYCRRTPKEVGELYEAVAGRLRQLLADLEKDGVTPESTARLKQILKEVVCPVTTAEATIENTPLSELLEALNEARLQEMFCLSLRAQVSKKQAASLVTGRLVPILVVDVDGGLARSSPTVGLDDIASVPFRAFLTGMLSVPWPKARPVDMKGFISVVGVTSTTPRAEDQLKKISLAILARDYMNFSLCLGYHASTIEAYAAANALGNYLRFHYQGGAASVERRVRRLKLISGILTRLGFEVSITGDLLDGRKHGDDLNASLKLLEILGRLEVFTKQMDMVMSSDEVIFNYIEDFLANHC